MITITKKQILGMVLSVLFGTGGWLAATEPIPVEPTVKQTLPVVPELAATKQVASPDDAMRYDDGKSVPSGAHMHCQSPPRRERFWRRGPIRRVVSAPFRWLFHRRCRWR